MSINLYKQNQSTDRIIDSVLYYLHFYSDTANKKTQRLDAATAVSTLLQFTVDMLHGDDASTRVLRTALVRIMQKAVTATTNTQELQNFSDEIGFLNMVNDR